MQENKEKTEKVNEMQSLFADRLRYLRNSKKISAREMSLELGQNVNYINLIENRKRSPSLAVFFEICDYFQMSPADFFNEKSDVPANEILDAFSNLSAKQTRLVIDFLKTIK